MAGILKCAALPARFIRMRLSCWWNRCLSFICNRCRSPCIYKTSVSQETKCRYNENHCYLTGRIRLTLFVNLSELSPFTPAVVDTVTGLDSSDPIAKRLRELGFVEGEPVRIVARGPIGADPLLVQIGFTRFALRRSEAERVTILPA